MDWEVVFKFISVAMIAILELWAAIPAGIALKIHPVWNAIASMTGAIIGVVLMAGIGSRIREWILRRKSKKDNKKGKIYDVWEKYGVIGLGLLAPILTGATFGTAIGISLGAKRAQLIFWMSMGIVIWTIILVALASLGMAGFLNLHV